VANIWLYQGTDASTTTNYNTAPDGSGSTGLPSAGDTLYITTPNELNAGLTALAAIALHSVYVNGPTTVVAGSALSLQIASSYYLYYNGTSGSSGSGTFSVIGATGIANIIASPQGGALNIASGTVTNLFVTGGQVSIAGAATVTNIYNYGGTVITYSGAGSTTLLESTAGSTTSYRNMTTVNCHGSAQVVTAGTSTYTTVGITGGIFNSRSSGTMTTVNLKTGVLTPAGNTNTPTITNLNVFGTPQTTQYFQQVGAGAFNVTTLTNYGGFVPAVFTTQPGQ